jgi:hypothetical protein
MDSDTESKSLAIKLKTEPECMHYLNQFLVTGETIICKFEKDQDGQISNRGLSSKKNIGNGKITKLLTQNKTFIVLHRSNNHKCYFDYYDDRLNFVKEVRYRYPNKSANISNIYLLDEKRFICHLNKDVALINIGNRLRAKILHKSTTKSQYVIDEEKNIIIAYNFADSRNHIFGEMVATQFLIKTLYAKGDYTKFKTQQYKLPRSFVSSSNQLHIYILLERMITYYESHTFIILKGYYHKEVNSYHVVYKHRWWGLTVWVDEWNYIDDQWMKHTILSELNIYTLYKINKTLDIPNVDLGDCSSVLIEDYSKWKNRMYEMLKDISCLDRISSDLLLIILLYIS